MTGQSITMPNFHHTEVIVLFVILLFGTCGINIIIITFLRTPSLQIKDNYFVLNLMIADGIILFYITPFTIRSLLHDGYPADDIWCTVNGAFLYALCVTSVLTLMLLALNRYVRICHTQYYRTIFTTKNVFSMCVSTWALGFLFSFPLSFREPVGYAYIKDRKMCFLKITESDQLFSGIVATLFMPTGFTVMSYMLLFHHFRKNGEHLSDNNWPLLLKRYILKESAKAQFLVFVVHIVFRVIPQVFVSISIYHRATIPGYIMFISTCLLFFTSALNCWVYILFNKHMWGNIRRAFTCFCRNSIGVLNIG